MKMASLLTSILISSLSLSVAFAGGGVKVGNGPDEKIACDRNVYEWQNINDDIVGICRHSGYNAAAVVSEFIVNISKSSDFNECICDLLEN